MDSAGLNEAAIFHAARRIAGEDPRRAYLEKACGGDTTLRERVEKLLRVEREEPDFLAVPVGQACAETIDTVREQPGTVIGPYKLLEEIGEGGFGVVFLAEQQQPIRRRVALKVLKPGMDTRHVIARFEAERQALALMDHAHIARIFDGGTTAMGRPYFVMELARGVPITAYCDQRRLPVRERLQLFITVCDAVQHAHQKGIIHRDLKPSNVLVTLDNDTPVVKVIDFGIAKATGQSLTDKTVFTHAAQLIGTPAYMSPEQVERNGLDVDTRTDIYALGVLLYELLAGTTPFAKERLHAAGWDEMRRIIREEEPAPPSIRARTGALPPDRGMARELDWIVLKAIEKDRNRRYDTASALAADVQRYQRYEPVLACPPSAGYRLCKFVRRNKGAVLAGAVIALSLVGGMIGTTWGLFRADAARGVAEGETKQKEIALAVAQKSERDAHDKLFLALLYQAQARRFSRQPGQRLDSVAALADAARIRPDERLRDEAIAALALPDIRRVEGWHAQPPGDAAVAYDYQYRRYARDDVPGTISVRSIPDDREILHIAAPPILAGYLFFSPDGRFLVALGAKDRTLHVWRLDDGQPVLHDEPRTCWAHAFSPDGRRLAVSSNGRVVYFDLATGREVKRWRLRGMAHALAFDRTGGRLAVGYLDERAVSVYDAATGALVASLDVGPVDHHTLAWHPDGDRLAVAGSDPRIQIWRVATRRKVATLEGNLRQRITHLTFHPYRDLLAAYGWDGVLTLWEPASGREVLRMSAVVPPQFSADGQLLGVVWDNDRADLLEVLPSSEYRTLASSAGVGRGGYGFGDISPDGRLLLIGMDDGARIWDLRHDRELVALWPGTSFAFFETRGTGAAGVPGAPGGAPCDDWPHSVLTAGTGGVLRWPLTRVGPGNQHWRLGWPRRLSPLQRAMFTRGPDGGTRIVATEESGPNQILALPRGTARQTLGPHPSGEVRTLSGDDRWAASAGWHSDRVRLWDLRTGGYREQLTGKRTDVFFTPDSKALITAGDEGFTFWDVQTLRPVRQLHRHIAHWYGWVSFSPDGKLMALEMAPGVIDLRALTSGRIVARLQDPHGDRASWQSFTPDGTQLVVISKNSSQVHIWDLRLLRTRLKALGLDWDWPDFPAAPAAPTEPLTIERKLHVWDPD